MKIKTFVSAAAVMAVLLTGCASKDSSSSGNFIHGKPEYTSDEFNFLSTEHFKFKVNNGFETLDTKYDEDNSDDSLPLSYTIYDEDIPLSLVIVDKKTETEPALEEEEAVKKLKQLYKANMIGGDIRNEHSSHDNIYTYIIDYSSGDISTAVAVASQGGHSLTIAARNYFTKDSDKVLPIVKDMIESTEYTP